MSFDEITENYIRGFVITLLCMLLTICAFGILCLPYHLGVLIMGIIYVYLGKYLKGKIIP